MKDQRKPKVAFVCVHNSCRSQIAEALGRFYGSDIFESYSAGTMIKERIQEDAVRLMKEKYHIDMEDNQYSKLLDDLPGIDIVITMGCNVSCPHVICQYREDWGLDDPSGQDDDVFLAVIDRIDEKIHELIKRIQEGSIPLKL